MFKQSILMTLLVIALPCSIYAQNIIAAGLKREYRSAEKISYTIQYPLADTVFVSIGLEERIENKWMEITDDISKKS